jgi:integrase/recombinase XerD
MLLNSGLRISEALGLKVADVRIQDGAVKSVRVIGQGNRERVVPLPEAFGALVGFWLKGSTYSLKSPKASPPGAHAARAGLRGLKDKAHLAKTITPHSLCHT